MKIVVLDNHGLDDLSWEPFRAFGELISYARTEPGELAARCEGAAVLFTNKTVLSGDFLATVPCVKFIGVLATGYNVVDVQAATRLGIVVSNVPNYASTSVAQHIFALLLHVTNHVGPLAEANSSGLWANCGTFCHWDEPLAELSGKTFGIVGFGNIGQATAPIALAFGMKVVAYTSKPQSALPEGVTRVSLDDLFGRSDVVSLSCPLTADNAGLVGTARLSQMKPSAILINAARGPLVDEAAVAAALHADRLGAYAADVMVQEPPQPSNPLLTAPHCFLTSHVAWATKEARQRLLDITLQNLRAFTEGAPENVV